jgi:hypothetical protein
MYSVCQAKKVLFIGNSMTYFNDMPLFVQNIAQSNNIEITVQSHTPGGTGFVNHVTDDNLYNIIRNNTFDIVVMQPGTGESAGMSNPTALTAQRGLQILDSIKKYNTCFKAFLYQIPYGVIDENSYSNYFTVQSRIEDSVKRIADIMQIPMIPAGECQYAYYNQSPDLLLNGSYNDVHPSYNGSYLVASAMYASIFQDSISGTQFAPNILPSNLSVFQQIVDSVVFTHSDLWRLDIFQQTSSFNYVLENNTISCFNTSQYYDSLFWEFSNGFTSNGTNPLHSFSENDTYTISLTTFKNGCEVESVHTISISTLDMNKVLGLNEIQIYPNPVEDILYVYSENELNRVEVISNKGEKIYIKKIDNTHEAIDLTRLPAGQYQLLIYLDNSLLKIQRLIKK